MYIIIIKYPAMNESITIFLIFWALATLTCSQQCNSTHLQYFSEYYLGRRDQLNKTFIKIQEKISTLNNVSWRANDTVTYRIDNVKPTFFYIDSKQRADIGSDTVIVNGGEVDVILNFDWSRVGFGAMSGNGTANALSDPISFAIQYIVKDGYLLQTLLDYDNVAFSNYSINITRINPAYTSQEDLFNLKRLLNDILNVTTVRHELQDEILKYFNYYLNQSLYDDRRIIDQYYQYVWNGTKGKFVVPLSINATGFDIEPTGITLTYRANIKNYKDWKCEFNAPTLPLNPQVYGGVQEFITYDVYKNILRYAVDNGQLDVTLNRRDWQSRLFQFYAGDLYQVIPKLATKFLASELVAGSCKTTSEGMDLVKGGYDFLMVSLLYKCELFITQEKILDFNVKQDLMVQGRPNETNIDFYVTNIASSSVTIMGYGDYRVQNVMLGYHMIQGGLRRLVGHRTFGSGWKLYTRDYPHYMTQDHYSIVYDSTHVDPHSGKNIYTLDK